MSYCKPTEKTGKKGVKHCLASRCVKGFFKLLPILLIFLSLLTFYSCSEEAESTSEEIRNQILEYRRDIADLNREITGLEKKLNDMGEQVLNRSGANVTISFTNKQDFDHYFKINGSVEAMNEAIISPETNGQIKSIFVQKGQRVERGQTVARLNTSVIENTIAETETNLNLARTIYERQKRLWDQEIGSEIQYLEAKGNYESLQARLRSLESQLDMAILRSPLTGIVDDIFLKEGELAMPGSRVMQIINLNRLYVNAEVSERYLPVLTTGDKVILRFPAYPGYEEEVYVHRIGNVINPENRTFRLQLIIDNPDERFKPNMVATLNIKSFESEDVIVVPSILIRQDIQGHYVFIASETNNGSWQASKTYIERGPEGEGNTVITSGLNEGDFLIVRGHNQLTEGTSLVIEQN